MKTFSFMLIVAVLISRPSLASAVSSYEKFQSKTKAHQSGLQIEGISYMVGGGLGLGTSLALGITSKEVLPKVGYSLIQTLSSAAIAYGGILYFTGDDLTRESEKLKNLENVLEKNKGLSVEQRRKILDESTIDSIQRALERRKKIKRIRGALELTTAASAGATLAFSQTGGAASNITLGFIILITTVGGVSDLWTADSKSTADAFTASLIPLTSGPSVSLSYHW